MLIDYPKLFLWNDLNGDGLAARVIVPPPEPPPPPEPLPVVKVAIVTQLPPM